MSNKTLLLSIVCLLIGFVCAYLIFSPNLFSTRQTLLNANTNSDPLSDNNSASTQFITENDSGSNDFEASNYLEERFENIENNITLIQQQLQEIDFSINTLSNTSGNGETGTASLLTSAQIRERQSKYRKRSITLEMLIRGGINSVLAEDFIRRKNAVDIQKLELNDRATRENYLNTQRYFDELAEIDLLDVNLREELGDDQYDEFLYKSKQTNRIKILSVMLGSAAEQAGIKKNDIVLSYDNKRMFTWAELKESTAQGELGEYTSINISRNGEVYSLPVLRGTLGIQMGATRLLP